MEETKINFETARLAKDKKFGYDFNKKLPEYVPMFYCESDNDDNLDLSTLEESECQGEDIVRVDFYFKSTQSLLQKWLREVHNIHIEIKKNIDGYSFIIYPDYELSGKWWINYILEMSDEEKRKTHLYNIYEEALEIGLQEGLKLIKDELD
jgi:hypothetical protein